MNAILLTVLALGGADAAIFGGGGGGGGEYIDGGCGDGGECDGGGWHNKAGHGGWLGPMPQSCYWPSFGCYPSTPWMHRYPAFHGTYYRKAYNYRNYFDYPWHAGLHEPTSHFSYHVPGEAPAAGGGGAVPRPTPDAAYAPRGGLRTATAEGRISDGISVTPYKVQR
ncbi:MAG TPA: hypothetical protein VFB80_22030 [Pirellulaceae bacterium]|nr:hypothetical protein [Pirellulaceae bacterium]